MLTFELQEEFDKWYSKEYIMKYRDQITGGGDGGTVCPMVTTIHKLPIPLKYGIYEEFLRLIHGYCVFIDWDSQVGVIMSYRYHEGEELLRVDTRDLDDDGSNYLEPLFKMAMELFDTIEKD